MRLTTYSCEKPQHRWPHKDYSSLQKPDYLYEESWIEKKCSKEFRNLDIKNPKKPKVDHFKTELKKHEAAKSLFFEKLPGLLKEYEGKYAVAINGDILIGEDKNELYERAIEKHGYTSMYLQKVSRSRRIITIRPRHNLSR